MEVLLTYIPAWVWPYLNLVTPLEWWYVANIICLLLIGGGGWGALYWFRRALGYEKFKGEWYGPEDAQKLKEELYSGLREGRLPDVETMAFLDKHIYGKESEFRRMSGRGWL